MIRNKLVVDELKLERKLIIVNSDKVFRQSYFGFFLQTPSVEDKVFFLASAVIGKILRTKFWAWWTIPKLMFFHQNMSGKILDWLKKLTGK